MTLRMLTLTALLPFASASTQTQAQAQAQSSSPGVTLTLREIMDVADQRDGRALAERALPAEVRTRIVEGGARRAFLPGQVYDLWFREAPRPVGSDRCERFLHRIVASAPFAPGDKAPDDTRLTLGELESRTEVAIMIPREPASAATCAAAGYILTGAQAERQLAAYGVLNAAIAAARHRNALPFAVSCRAAEAPGACDDARAVLAALPLFRLFGISISCLDSNRIAEPLDRGVRIVRCAPLEPGRPYQAEASFEADGSDGQSWRVSFVHRGGWPVEMALRRSTIISH